MRFYSIFDDFTDEAIGILANADVDVVVHPLGEPRPSADELKQLLEEYDGLIIGTSAKMPEYVFDDICCHKVIATASVGIDHICVPTDKKELITIINTPKANARSVAEYTIGCALACVKRLAEGQKLFNKGMTNKQLIQKPEDLCGKIMGVVGAGSISAEIIKYAKFFGMEILCWTRCPERHNELKEYVSFVTLEHLVEKSDIISVNLPNVPETKQIISDKLVQQMKNNAIFISVSRTNTLDIEALMMKAQNNQCFYACLDIDTDREIADRVSGLENVFITPHIAGGTVETRKRMFRELAEQIGNLV